MKWLNKLSIFVLSFFLILGPLYADMGPRRVLLLGGSASAILPPPLVPNQPDIFFDFTKNVALQKTSGTSTATSLLTTNRSTTAYVNDSSGNWSLVAANTPRLSNLGLLVEEGRTNSLRNNSMQGAIVMADGVELLTNGNFAAGGTGWTVQPGAGSASIAVGAATLVGDGSTNGTYIARQLTGLVVGRNYVVSFVAGNTATINVLIGTVPGGNTIASGGTVVNGNNSPTLDRIAFTAPAGPVWVTFARLTATTATINQVSVQDGERAENGGFTFSPTNAAQSTVQNGWQWTTNTGTGTVVYNSGPKTVTLTGDGTNSVQIDVAIPTLAGQTYTITADCTVNAANVQAGTVTFGGTLLAVTMGVGTGQKFQFTATGSTSHVNFTKVAATPATIANISVQSAGSFPTNWVAPNLNAIGVVANVVGIGVESGIDYIDIRTVGTSTSTSQVRLVQFDSSAQVAAQYGQVWVGSMFATLKAGSFSNLDSAILDVTEIPVGSQHGVSITGLTNGVLGLSRLSNTTTLLTSTTTNSINRILLTPSGSSVAIDFTLRIGWPQFENAGSFLTVSTASAVTAASGTGGVNGTAVYQVGGGTVTTSATTLNVTWASGVLTVNSVASSGGYSPNGYPPSPAPLTYVSGTATGWTGATVTLTPGQITSASITSSSPVRTVTVAVTRSPDAITRSAPFGATYSMWAQGTPIEPAGSLQSIFSVSVDSSNRTAMLRGSGTNIPQLNVTGGTGTTINSSGTQTTGVDGKYAGSLAAGAQAFSFGGDIHTASVATLPNTPTSMTWGPNGGTALFYWNGFVEKSAAWYSQAVPNTFLQSITQ